MLRIVATALFCCVFGAFGSPSVLPKLDGRIVGGEDVNIEDFPYQISLQYYGSHICGGSIISANWVLTAAHCTDGNSASTFSVRAGSSRHNSGGQVINVAKIIQHPQYNPTTVDYDISVLKLASALTFGTNVKSIPMALLNVLLPPGTTCVVSGWGALAEGGSSPTQLQAVNVPIVSQADCRNAYGQSAITDRMICAGYTAGGKDACQGDSGGPLAHDRGVLLGKELVGIVSWGYGCARPNYPGVYTNVANFRLWVSLQTGIIL